MNHYSCHRSVFFVGFSTQVYQLLLVCLCPNVVVAAVPTPALEEVKAEERACLFHYKTEATGGQQYSENEEWRLPERT